MKQGQVLIEVVAGAEGPSLNIGDEDTSYRLAGPKAWGGGRAVYRFTVNADELRQQLAEYAPAAPAEAASAETATAAQRADVDTSDADRLEWMAARGAWIGWSRDYEYCRVFIRDDDGDTVPAEGWGPGTGGYTAREAIDAAMAATAQQETN
ncbi:hypothetical protein [Ralstonia pseudosolanacearum]